MLPSLSALLKPPFATYAGADFLRYVQQRTHVTYFALRDAEQASPAQIQALHDKGIVTANPERTSE